MEISSSSIVSKKLCAVLPVFSKLQILDASKSSHFSKHKIFSKVLMSGNFDHFEKVNKRNYENLSF